LRRRGVVKPRILRILLTLVETTSLPLLVLCMIYLLTGYQILLPGLKLIPMARVIHTDLVLRVSFIVLTLIHSYSGLIILCERRIKNNTLRTLIESTITGLIVIFTALFIIIEIMISS
jgi:succinate dehydrogenase hydrophobic anchor subunit